MNTRREINEIETKIIEKSNETKSWFFEKINKIDSLQLDSPCPEKRTKINKIRNERVGTTNTTGIQSIIRDYYERMDLSTWGGGRVSWDEVREWH